MQTINYCKICSFVLYNFQQRRNFNILVYYSSITMSNSIPQLPPIKQMYKIIKTNNDYSVKRNYVETSRSQKLNCKPTKRGHYIDDILHYAKSPGPANTSNHHQDWAKKSNIHKSKSSDRMTYLGLVQRQSKKENFPSPNKYKIILPWPKEDKNKACHYSQKLTFLDSSQFQGIKQPGPGQYNISLPIAQKKKDGKIALNCSKIKKENKAADMTTYDPISLQYSSFASLERMNKNLCKPKVNNRNSIEQKKDKNIEIPGPGHYNVLNHWKGKENLNKQQKSYLNKITLKSQGSVYYGSKTFQTYR